jgi:hypothetical protein
MALFLGPGGAVAVVYATSDRSKDNTREIEILKPLPERVSISEGAIIEIRSSVKTFSEAVSAVQTQQSDILSGIEELKSENVNRLKQELRDARRELRSR